MVNKMLPAMHTLLAAALCTFLDPPVVAMEEVAGLCILCRVCRRAPGVEEMELWPKLLEAELGTAAVEGKEAEQ
ncbi:hypothetical protein NDU88_009884 [Pleurodeles waltl]|uniref:Secreted protein n=1 Tax=Pleurodeles waltl TaxID=8319 RepID=A0AAV7PUG6_PLEWA|nr:hypothetical protein NDU88_009884 [Pleurodeles waltl]